MQGTIPQGCTVTYFMFQDKQLLLENHFTIYSRLIVHYDQQQLQVIFTVNLMTVTVYYHLQEENQKGRLRLSIYSEFHYKVLCLLRWPRRAIPYSILSKLHLVDLHFFNFAIW